LSIAPFSSNLPPPASAGSPAASFLAPATEPSRKADREQDLYSQGARPPGAADSPPRSKESPRDARTEPGRSPEESERVERARSRFARILEEKLRRFEEKKGTRPDRSGKDSGGEEGTAGVRPEKELLELLRRAWSAAHSAEAGEGARGTDRPAEAAARKVVSGKGAAQAGAEETGSGEQGRSVRTAAQAAAGKASGSKENAAGSAAQRAPGHRAAKARASGRESGEPAQAERGEGKSSANGRTPRLTVLDLRSSDPRSVNLRTPGQESAAAGAVAGGKGNPRRNPALRAASGKGDTGTNSNEAAAGKGAPGKAGREEVQRSPAGPDKDFATLLKAHTDRSFQADGQHAAEAQKTAPSLKTFQERFIPEVLRHTGIILKDGGSGEIRLLLKPESLGSVRIRLALSETSLEGRIVVENSTVKELLDGTLEHLKQALREGGFQSASLEVAVDSRHDNHPEQGAVPVARVAGDGTRELEHAVPPLVELISAEPSLVNLVV
jgi:flagellar hook-length control protein FliK